MKTVLLSKQLWIAVAVVVIVAAVGRAIHVKAEPVIPPSAEAAGEWITENIDEVRAAKETLARFDKEKAVLETHNCQYDWEKLTILDCPLE